MVLTHSTRTTITSTTALMSREFPDEAVRYSAQYPELLDVRIIGMSPQAFTLAGFERIEGAEYAQSWLVGRASRLLSCPRCGTRATADETVSQA